jgi:hypothetical protein
MKTGRPLTYQKMRDRKFFAAGARLECAHTNCAGYAMYGVYEDFPAPGRLAWRYPPTLRVERALGCYCAFIQVSDPVSLTDTSEKKRCSGLPSAVPRWSVEIRRGPAFL